MNTYIKPMEIHFDENKRTGNIMWAQIQAKDVSTPLHPYHDRQTVYYERKKDGSYSSNEMVSGTTQLNIITDMQEALEQYKGKKVALRVIGSEKNVLKALNYDEAKKYLQDMKTLHVSKAHALAEMKELITFASKDDGIIDGFNNTLLDEFARTHGMKLYYKEVTKAKREELVGILEKSHLLAHGSDRGWDMDQLAAYAKKHHVKFAYEELKNLDEARIQDVQSKKDLGRVKGLNISTREKWTIGY